MTKIPLRLQYLLLLLFPLAFLALQILLKIDYRYFFLSIHDPAYGYLFNGLNLAQGNMQLGLYAHPGTPLHCLVAFNLFILNIFSRGTNLPYSVLENPEYYLNIISYEIVIINTIALILLGFWVCRRTGNLPLALALQLSPFVSLQGISFDSVVMLEPIMLCIEIFVIMLLAGYIFGQSDFLRGNNLIIIGILIGLIIATKIVALPLVFMPLFAFSGFRKKMVYLGIVIFSLMVFLIPIYKVFPEFLSWMKALFLHSGIYGKGEADIIEIQKYMLNLKFIFSSNYLFTTCFVLTFMAWIGSLFKKIRQKIDPKKHRIMQGLVLVFILNIIMVAKHFSVHYLIVSHNLVVFGFILDFSILWETTRLKIKRSPHLYSKVTGILAIGTLLLFIMVKEIHFDRGLVSPLLKTLNYVRDDIKNTQRIIVLEASCPFIETALFHGCAFSGGMKPIYAGILKQDFPDTYFYDPNQDLFLDWSNEYNVMELLSQSPRTYVYYKSLTRNDTLPPVLATRLKSILRDNYLMTLVTVYKNTLTAEYIYELDVDDSKIKSRIIKHELAYCDFEKANSDSRCRLKNTLLLSEDASFSGTNSVKLDQQNPFGPGLKILLKKGFYEITVMRKSIDRRGLIVASGTDFYKGNSTIDSVIQGWDKIRLILDIPDSMEGREISIYLWYPGDGTCYFDDFKITRFEVI